MEGRNSLNGATIYSYLKLTIEIYDENDASFYIYCNLGDICQIRCHKNNSCTTLNLYCYGTCLVDCKGSLDNTCLNLMDGNYSQWITTTPTFIPTNPTYNPTYIPTYSPTHIPTRKSTCDTKNNESPLHDVTFELSSYNQWILIGITILCVLLVVISTMLSKYQNYKKLKQINIDESKNVHLLKSKSSLNEIYLPKKIQHFTIFTFGSTIYDIFNDASTSIMLYYFVQQSGCKRNKYHKYHLLLIILFIVHLVCLMLSFIVNIYIVRKMFLMEFMKSLSRSKLHANYDYSNSHVHKFRDWFKHYASRNILFFFICALSIFNIELMAILTSKTFNLNLFCAPFTFETIKFLKLQSIFSILLENIPQLTIQIIILKIGIAKDKLSMLNVISIVWSILEILQMFIAYIIWRAVDKTHKQTMVFDDLEMASFASHGSDSDNENQK